MTENHKQITTIIKTVNQFETKQHSYCQ